MQITIKTTTLPQNLTIHIESITTPTYTITPKVPIEGEWEEVDGDGFLYFFRDFEEIIVRMEEVKWDGARFEVRGEISQYNFNHLLSNI